ncbi:bifunctional DNA-formamidopyrimidine glycosylase/DNA-(apurinic or apyrimidinic site) lyase [Paenochrobactrum pullorum]|uniref:bifunctional DNA-formamidopyrimidine glycosylase/DNA-(apurinic or apyrimidinic site) lyase n=1 Tax=Paenochrobactrum pullorum TaxID=1324351 RepID=UPI0035BC2FE9
MPELPEVETVRRGLQPFMEGAKIEKVQQNRADLRFPFPEKLSEKITGKRIEALGRRAKYLTIHLEDDQTLISHLGMSGSYRIESDAAETVPGQFTHERSKKSVHDHLIFSLSNDQGRKTNIIYNDPRRFGFLVLAQTSRLDQHPFLEKLGLEPTGNYLSGEWLDKAFAGKKAPLKAALLDQSLIAGLGNIYVCEAMWRTGLSPLRSAGSVTTQGGADIAVADRLATNIREVIADAIAAGGSSLRDYRQADGELGYFQHSFSVYGREGEPCRREGCKGTISRITQSGRSTFWCESCQH